MVIKPISCVILYVRILCSGDSCFLNHLIVKKGGFAMKKMRVLFFIILLAIAAGVAGSLLYDHHQKQKVYDSGQELLEKKNYEGALEIFHSLGSFSDSEEKVREAEHEIAYLSVENLAAEGKLNEVISILRERGERYGSTPEGTRAMSLAAEYALVQEAGELEKQGEYGEAGKKLEDLSILKDTYLRQRCLDLARDHELSELYEEVLLDLYGILSGDADRQYLESPQTEEDKTMVQAGRKGDFRTIVALLKANGIQEDKEAEPLLTNAENWLKYQEAKQLFDEEKYTEAKNAFLAIEDFQDAAEWPDKADKAAYEKAEKLAASGQYGNALVIFQELGDYRNAKARYEETGKSALEKGDALLNEKKYRKAMDVFRSLGEYADAPKRYENAGLAGYQAAEELEKEENYKKAADIFKSLGKYADSRERYNAAIQKAYQAAMQLLQEGQYKKAADAFKALDDFSDSQKRYKKAMQSAYKVAKQYLKSKDYDNAIKAFTEIKNYSDAKELLQKAKNGKAYQVAEQAFAAGQYKKAADKFKALKDYSDAEERYTQAMDKAYEMAVQYLNTKNYEKAIEAFTELDGYRDSVSRIREADKERRTKNLVEFVNSGKASVSISCGAINYASITVTNISNEEIIFYIAPGTFLSAHSTSYQNMLVVESYRSSLSPGGSQKISLDTCCMNRTRSIPKAGNGFSLSMTPNWLLQRLADYCQKNSVGYAVRQAATWIITDNASYADCGILSYSPGGRVIGEGDYNTAVQIVNSLRAGG